MKLGVNPQAVKAWEKSKNGSDPKLKNLLAMCELYQCDLDYLIGRIEERTHDNKTACELTGLSERAVIKIRNQQLNYPMSEILSRMIESDRFENLLTTFRIYLEFLVKLKPGDAEDVSPWEELSNDRVVLSKNSAVNHFKQEVALAMTAICEGYYIDVIQHIAGWRGKFKEILDEEQEE